MIGEWIGAGVIELAERGYLPDRVIRAGIRRLCAQRLTSLDFNRTTVADFARACRTAPLAPVPEKANQQHYEVPAEFFELVLGRRKKYSSCFYRNLNSDPPSDLDAAEDQALQITCEHAELTDGIEILELGCGWGSLTLWMLEHYPNARVTAVSNSHSQRASIEKEAQARGFEGRLTVITADMNDFQAPGAYDRVVSVEMFEHMRNHAELLRRIAGWLRPGGKLFVHVFCHARWAYTFEEDGATNWMGRFFFSGGIMPSEDLFSHYSDDLQIVDQWQWNGQHYQQTSDAWVRNLDKHRDQLLPILARIYGVADAYRWWQRWRMLFMAGAELFGYSKGSEWGVAHYLFMRDGVRL